MSQNDIGNKIPIYKLKAGKEVEDYYEDECKGFYSYYYYQ